MSEKPFNFISFTDDGVECNNNYNYALLDTYYEFDGKRIIEWNKHSDNAEYTDFEKITEILNIKQMRLESLMKHREEIGKLFDRIDEQQDTITGFQEKIFELRDDKEQLHTEISKLRQEVAELKTRNAVLSSHLHRIPPKIREVWLE